LKGLTDILKEKDFILLKQQSIITLLHSFFIIFCMQKWH